jgi:hypothetical protein
MSLSTEQAAFLLDACKLIQYATEQGFKVTGGELSRTPEQQALHVKAGRSKTMRSLHLKRCAIDLNFFQRWQDHLGQGHHCAIGCILGIFKCQKSMGR